MTTSQSDSIIRKCDKYSPEPIGEELIKDTRMKANAISDFLTNPFLVTLLYNCYFYNKNIPINKSEFYEEIYTALFKRHDLSKEKFERTKRSGLDSHAFRQVLRKFAFNGAKKGNSDYSETLLIEAIKEAQETLVGIPNFDAIHFCEDLVKQVPLMVREGLHIKWSHKSLQDYFAAEYICQDEKKADIIVSIFKSKNFYRNANLFDFIIEKDYSLIREHILYNILKEFKLFVEHVKKVNPNISSEEAESLSSYLFDCEIFGTKDDKLVASNELYEQIWLIAKYEVDELMHHEARVNGDEVFLFVSTSNASTVLNMINNKGVDNLIIPKMHDYKVKNFEFSKYIKWLPRITNLTSDAIIAISDREFLAEYLKFLDNVSHKPRLDYKKAMSVLKDIEQLNARKNAEDSSFF